ncbi:hypothetical protein D3C81_2110600 [compost metagenome]
MLSRQTTMQYRRRSVSPRRRASTECMSVQNAQPLSCEARILTRCSSDGSMLRWLVRASMAIIAFIALGEAL